MGLTCPKSGPENGPTSPLHCPPAERVGLRLAVAAAPEGLGDLEQPQLAQARPRVPLERLADPVVAVGVLQLAGVQRQRSAKENRSYIIGLRDF